MTGSLEYGDKVRIALTFAMMNTHPNGVCDKRIGSWQSVMHLRPDDEKKCDEVIRLAWIMPKK